MRLLGHARNGQGQGVNFREMPPAPTPHKPNREKDSHGNRFVGNRAYSSKRLETASYNKYGRGRSVKLYRLGAVFDGGS